jgi:hypothetical protein
MVAVNKAMAATIELNGPLDFVMCRPIRVVFAVLSMWCLAISWLSFFVFIGLFDIALFLYVRRR